MLPPLPEEQPESDDPLARLLIALQGAPLSEMAQRLLTGPPKDPKSEHKELVTRMQRVENQSNRAQETRLTYQVQWDLYSAELRAFHQVQYDNYVTLHSRNEAWVEKTERELTALRSKLGTLASSLSVSVQTLISFDIGSDAEDTLMRAADQINSLPAGDAVSEDPHLLGLSDPVADLLQA